MRSSPRPGTTTDPADDLWNPAYDPGRISAPGSSAPDRSAPDGSAPDAYRTDAYPRGGWDPADPPTDPALPVVPAFPEPRGHAHDELPAYPTDRSAFVAGRTTEIPAVVPGGPDGTGWEYGSWAGRSWERPDYEDYGDYADYADEDGRDLPQGPHASSAARFAPGGGHAGFDDRAGFDLETEFDDRALFDDRAGSRDYAEFDEYGDLDAPRRAAGDREFPDVEDFDGEPGRDTPSTELVPVGRPRASRLRMTALLVPAVVGIALSVGLGVYARVHEPTGVALSLAGFSSGVAAKSWLTALAFAFGLAQLWSALRMSGRFGRGAGPRTFLVHRWAGRIAVLLTLPVAVHCLYALGFADTTPRVLIHSLAGCLFYGAFATKMLVLPRRAAPRWALPVLGGVVFALLTGLFLTSSMWFFTTHGVTF
ncbi:hypothetical protein GCM10009836_08610 [Pseudonocardia ailaonensis]|uniref:Yip1 domain-containing protein n=1 Tax=Pseudonocardia ailaonensis TaxID=367279 RepID=A0ABN2MNI3_9PSEU